MPPEMVGQSHMKELLKLRLPCLGNAVVSISNQYLWKRRYSEVDRMVSWKLGEAGRKRNICWMAFMHQALFKVFCGYYLINPNQVWDTVYKQGNGGSEGLSMLRQELSTSCWELSVGELVRLSAWWCYYQDPGLREVLVFPASGTGKVRIGFHLWLPNPFFPPVYIHLVGPSTGSPSQNRGPYLTFWTIPGITREKGNVLV